VRCLALDVGERRIGLAVGELLARPLTTLVRRSKAEDFSAVAHLVRAHKVDRIVVGLPLDMDGSVGMQAQRVMRYAEECRVALMEAGVDVDLVFWDERLSTEEASEAPSVQSVGPLERRHRIDAVAAAVILQRYLDEQVNGF
jgi:putative Holliday junction resolvase